MQVCDPGLKGTAEFLARILPGLMYNQGVHSSSVWVKGEKRPAATSRLSLSLSPGNTIIVIGDVRAVEILLPQDAGYVGLRLVIGFVVLNNDLPNPSHQLLQVELA